MGGSARGKPRGAVRWVGMIFPTIMTPRDPLINEGTTRSPGETPVSTGAARSQKGRSHQSDQPARVSWHAHFALRRKSGVVRSILVRSRPRLAGSSMFDVPQGLVFFSDLFLQICPVTLFGPASKIMFM